MEITVIVCDICRDSRRETSRYEISRDDVRGVTDRCEEHGSVFEAALEEALEEEPQASPPPARAAAARINESPFEAPRTPTKRAAKRQLTSVASIEAAKVKTAPRKR